MGKKYISVIEYNYWEREKWVFFISTENNTESFALLTKMLDAVYGLLPNELSSITIGNEIFSEEVVDTLVGSKDLGCWSSIPSYTKLNGLLLTPKACQLNAISPYLLSLYRGGITNFVVDNSSAKQRTIEEIRKKFDRGSMVTAPIGTKMGSVLFRKKQAEVPWSSIPPLIKFNISAMLDCK